MTQWAQFNMFRYYDPTVGRYLNADPLGPYGLMLSQLAVPDGPTSSLLLPSPLLLPPSESDFANEFASGRDDIEVPLRDLGTLELNTILGTRVSSGIDGNVFSYVVNSPTNLVDPRGQFGSLGLRVAARALGRAAAAAKAFARNVQFDGPQGTRICQVRYRRLPVVRLDYGKYPGTGGEPRLQLHLPRLFPGWHIPLDPRRLFD